MAAWPRSSLMAVLAYATMAVGATFRACKRVGGELLHAASLARCWLQSWCA
jgi:hypothetical protein